MLHTSHTIRFLTSVCRCTSVIVFAFSTNVFLAHAAKVESICDRTPQVSSAILNMLSNVSDCASITMSDLAEIFVLNLSNVNLSTLQADDFNGLSNLTDLDLQNNQLSTLPESIFSNLQRLNRIRLGNNNIEELPDGVFSNLPSLDRLGLNNNQLKTLSDNLFANVPNLFELDLRGNQLGDLPNNIFDNLPVLTTLGLDQGNLDNPSFPIPTTVKRLQLIAPIIKVQTEMSSETIFEMSSATIFETSSETETSLVTIEDVGELASAGIESTECGKNTPPSTMSKFRVGASRLFAAENQYPPTSFAAYGIIAFRSLATEATSDRYIAICEGYSSSILSFHELVCKNVERSQQMVTIWPLKRVDLADTLNSNVNDPSDYCQEIVRQINLTLSQNSIKTAEIQMGTKLTGDGPFLLAWSPSQNINEEDTLVLSLNLSRVTNVQQATRMFNFWIDEIEKDSKLWSSGWNLERFRLKVMLAADRIGNDILQLLGRAL